VRRRTENRDVVGHRDRHQHNVDITRPKRLEIVHDLGAPLFGGAARVRNGSRVDAHDIDVGIQAPQRGQKRIAGAIPRTND
jgi:hypothetical protein